MDSEKPAFKLGIAVVAGMLLSSTLTLRLEGSNQPAVGIVPPIALPPDEGPHKEATDLTLREVRAPVMGTTGMLF